jgi:Ni,Fe-hydrogenase I small subunit
MTKRANLTKATCSRCNGSGHHSFNLIYGTVCFKCDGAGFVMINMKNEARNKKARELRDSQTRARMDMMRAAYQEIIERMNVIHQVAKVDTPLGIQTLDHAVIKATGKSIAQHRDELMATREG